MCLYKKKNFIKATDDLIFKCFLLYKKNIYVLQDELYKHELWQYYR
jgi:hypothetical protein